MRIWDTLAEAYAKNNLSSKKLRIVIVGISQATGGIDSPVFVWARTKSVCAKLGWSRCYESFTNLNKKCCGRLNRDWIRSSQPSPCVFKILFILLQVHKMNKTREHLTTVEDKCLQCSRFFLILPSTPCSNLKASKINCLKCTLKKCFLIKFQCS